MFSGATMPHLLAVGVMERRILRDAGGFPGCAKGRAKPGTWATVELVVTSNGGPVKAGPKRNARGTVADGSRAAAAESQAWPLADRRSGAVQTASGGPL